MSRLSELFLEHQKSVSQFAYFQLGVAASAIAFAVHQTKGRSLDDTPWPIGAAVICWAISFALGSFGVDARLHGLARNARLMMGMEKIPPQFHEALKETPQYAETEAEVEEAVNRPQTRFRWQMRFLFLGALAYVAGHIMDMAKIP